MQSETSNLSHLILERLKFVESILSINQNKLSGDWDRIQVKEIQQSSSEQIEILDRQVLAASLTSGVLQQLASGRSIIIATGSAGSVHPTTMVKQLMPGEIDSPFITFGLSEQDILSPEEERNLNNQVCVIGAEGALFYATNELLCTAFNAEHGGHAQYKGHLLFGADKQYFASYRSLLMGPKFATEDWLVVVVQPTRDLFLSSAVFKSNFYFIAVAVILSLALASLYFIRIRMAPLSVIMEGIERVSSKRYNQPVEVYSGDEFQELAEAINKMSGQVSQQLNTMASMSEIDQLMLSRQTMGDVIRVVLDKADSILPCEAVGLVLMEDESKRGEGQEKVKDGATLYFPASSPNQSVEECRIALLPGWTEHLHQNSIWLRRSRPKDDQSLFSHFKQPIGTLCLLPLRRGEKLAGFVLLGYSRQPERDEEAEAVAKNLADRISVALANSEWEEKLFNQAHYDSLTGLPNRLSMQDRIDLLVKQCSRSGNAFAVSFIDLDDFKLVNDALGHIVGDELIEVVANRLKGCVRQGDMVSRMGGDEFVFISTAFPSNESAALTMSRISEKILQVVAEPVDIGGREIRASASMGIAIYPRDGDDSIALLRNADAAMYAAKDQGRSSFHFFSEKLNEESVALMTLSSDIKRALNEGEFELHYQPKVNLQAGSLVGAEALIRWHHPTRGMVPPNEFIDVAERLGIVGAIGDWTLREACRQIKVWDALKLRPPRVAVNMSAIQIQQEDIAAKLRLLLEEYQIDARYLELEIVESVLVKDIVAASKKLDDIRELGVHISVDDYGTGYSSLSYLKHFPVNALKVDQSFIVNLCTDAYDQAIVASTILLAHSLDLVVIAEGVETEQQVKMLQSLGCDQIQGYFCGRPVPAEDFATHLQGTQQFLPGVITN
ncbi:MAG: diguanylate cyclase (GGDEF)-like protein [Halioglobus sp.]